jgi:hypothetical protein
MKKPIIRIHRINQDKNQTLGTCTVLDHNNKLVFTSLALERGWRNNENRVSCYPAGVFTVKLEFSDRFKKKLWEVKNVPGRSECKFHAANFWASLEGCTALGLRLRDLNKDNYDDITNSVDTMAEFHLALAAYTEAVLIVTTEPNVK